MQETLTSALNNIQGFLFPMLREEVGPLAAQRVQARDKLDISRIETFVRDVGLVPTAANRHALARAFVAKAVVGDHNLWRSSSGLPLMPCSRRLCGWESRRGLPSKSTFSRALAKVHGKQPASARARSAHSENPGWTRLARRHGERSRERPRSSAQVARRAVARR